MVVDTEKLAFGLEKGVGETNTPYIRYAPEERLRAPICGLASAAIASYARSEGIEAQLYISTPRFPFEPDMQHVVTIVNGEGLDGTIIDAAPSQFLAYAGMTLGYEDVTGEKIYPPEKIFHFTIEQRYRVVDWLTKTALKFHESNVQPIGKLGFRLGEGALVGASNEEIRQTYDQIWNPRNLKAYSLPPDTEEQGLIVSRHIPRGTIELSG